MRQSRMLHILHPEIPLQTKLAQELDISPITAQILINRGLRSCAEAHKFLNAKLDQLLDPYSFPDMPVAVKLIKEASRDKKKVLIFGDYDVDGITALAVLKNALAKIGLKPFHYIPHRIKEGYGLNKNILQIAKDKGVELLITADCGTSSHNEIRELKRHHIEVIVTDHHEQSCEMPTGAAAVINPKLKNTNYGFRDLAGVGVAYKLAQALTQDRLTDELDLVTLGTIADVVPLLGENRVIVKEGLARFHLTKKTGLRALIESASLKDKKFSPYFISYIIGPRLNASGRMSTAETALELLLSTDKEEAVLLAKKIELFNRQRQQVEGRILEEAAELIDREVDFKEQKIIVVAKEDWHQGVLGVVASKLSDRFYRPTILISLDKDLCKGSARSIKNFHLFSALLECRDLLENFGGHAHAAGLLISKDKIKAFRKAINEVALKQLRLEDLIPSLDADIQVNLSDLNEEIIRELGLLEPFGMNNPQPLFYTTNLRLKGEPLSLARDTLKFWVTDGQATFQAIGFGKGSLKESLISTPGFDLVYTPRMDSWGGNETVILEAEDIFFR